MNRVIYQATRRSIRDNGLRYTLQHAIDTDDTDTMLTVDEIVNIMKLTDWLAMRQQFARTGSKAVAFKLTTPLLEPSTI